MNKSKSVTKDPISGMTMDETTALRGIKLIFTVIAAEVILRETTGGKRSVCLY